MRANEQTLVSSGTMLRRGDNDSGKTRERFTFAACQSTDDVARNVDTGPIDNCVSRIWRFAISNRVSNNAKPCGSHLASNKLSNMKIAIRATITGLLRSADRT